MKKPRSTRSSSRTQFYHMEKTLIVANWKSNFILEEALKWLEAFRFAPDANKEVLICPAYTILPYVKNYISTNKLPVKTGAQDISPFDEGAYTGEVNGRQIKEFADYVLIGHSERRKNLAETDDLLARKVDMANKYGLQPIYFVQDSSVAFLPDVRVFVYEPPASISPGPADTPENAENASVAIKRRLPSSEVLYGGNVTSANVKGFTQMANVAGVLVGRASLDPQEFVRIIQNA